MSNGWSSAWVIVRVLLVIFVVTGCWTTDYLKNGGSWVVAGLAWASVITAIVVFVMGISYLADRSPKRAPPPPYPTAGMTYGLYPYQAASLPVYTGPRPCRNCDGFLFTPSPICPKCGRKN